MSEVLMEGMAGEPLPYLLRSDWAITSVIFLCMMLLGYVLSSGKKHLYHQFKSFFSSRERGSLFDEVTASDMRYTFLLLFHTCVLLGFCIYDYLSHHTPLLFQAYSHLCLLGGLTGCIFVYMILKWVVYQSINWIFFSKNRNMIWIESYFNVMTWVGILLFPIVLLIVYFDLSSQSAYYLTGFIIVLAKITLFCKCFSNFFGKIHGVVHLILYFCALEILPDFLLWKGIEMVNNNLILNT